MIARSSQPLAPIASPVQDIAPIARLLGTVGMICSPFLFLSFVANSFQNSDGKAGALLGLVFTVGWFSNVLGLRMLNAAGRRLPAKILLGIEMIGVTLAALCQIYEIVAPGSTSILYTITDIAWPLSMLTLLIIGIVAIFARTFDGWLRFAPLFATLWLPFSILVYPLGGETFGMAAGGIHNALGWLLIGYAVFRSGKLAARD